MTPSGDEWHLCPSVHISHVHLGISRVTCQAVRQRCGRTGALGADPSLSSLCSLALDQTGRAGGMASEALWLPVAGLPWAEEGCFLAGRRRCCLSSAGGLVRPSVCAKALPGWPRPALWLALAPSQHLPPTPHSPPLFKLYLLLVMWAPTSYFAEGTVLHLLLLIFFIVLDVSRVSGSHPPPTCGSSPLGYFHRNRCVLVLQNVLAPPLTHPLILSLTVCWM